jgi:Cof subfamily protein (haloacid dehalogenase superfamily)
VLCSHTLKVVNKYRLIAIDIDGTLLSPQSRLTDRTRDAVHEAIEAGFVITLATGRNWTESRTILTDLGFAGPCVFVGGAMVVDTRDGQTLYCQRMQAGLARELCAMLESDGHAACALQHTAVAGVDYLISDADGISDALTRWLAVTAATHRRVPVGQLARDGHEHTVRVGVVAPTEQVRALQSRLDGQFGGRIVQHAIHVPAYGVDVLEAFDPQVSKWRGIREIAARHGIDDRQVIAIGDDVNDIPMLRSAGLGVAMGNARPGVRESAKLCIASNAEDGLARFLEALVEGRIIGEPTGAAA